MFGILFDRKTMKPSELEENWLKDLDKRGVFNPMTNRAKINEAVRDICAVPTTKSKTRAILSKLLQDQESDRIKEIEEMVDKGYEAKTILQVLKSNQVGEKYER